MRGTPVASLSVVRRTRRVPMSGGLPEQPDVFGEWTPPLDVAETADALVVRAEVPGIDPAEIHLALRDQVLTLAGEKRSKEHPNAYYFRMERACGTFARAVRLPMPVDGSKVTVVFKNGLLTVTLPKAAVSGTAMPIAAA